MIATFHPYIAGLVTGFLLGLMATLLARDILGQRRAEPTDDAEPAVLKSATTVAETSIEASDEPFAVARRERRPSWRERRRELEAKHRTERKKLEEWRD